MGAEMTPWIVQVFAISDVRAEELIVGLLSGIKGVVVQGAASGPERFLVTESADVFQAESVRRIVMSIDFDARLLHTTSGPREPELQPSRVPSRMVR
jgi:hypothetical protein